MIRQLLVRAIRWVFFPTHARHCPYDCPQHYKAWAEWRSRKDRPGFRPSEYER